VLWLDAHADFNTSELSPSGNIHGMPVACLCGFGPRELTGLSGVTPALSPKTIRQVGIRSVDQGEKKFVHEQGLEVFDMRYIDEWGMKHTMQQALAGLDAGDASARELRRRLPRSRTSRRASAPRSPGGPTYRERSCAWK
jgi:arginase